MKTSLRLVIMIVLMGLALSGGQSVSAAVAAQSPASAGTDQLMVWFDAPAGKVGPASMQRAALEATTTRLVGEAGLEMTYLRALSDGGHVLSLEQTLPAGAVLNLAARLAEQPGVSRVEPDWLLKPTAIHRTSAQTPFTGIPNDLGWASLWALKAYDSTAGQYNAGIDAQAAWQYTTGEANLVIAVIDTGIIDEHVDLDKANRFVSGYDFISVAAIAGDGDGWDPDPEDMGMAADCAELDKSFWHGSHVAGTIAATPNNGIGITGINWQSKIMPVRVLGCSGGYISDIADAIRWSAGLVVYRPAAPFDLIPPPALPARIINLSLGGPIACSDYFQEAINAARGQGAVVVAAAGNAAIDASAFTPASCSGVITVGATSRSGMQANYSNYGSTVEVSAPGGEFLNQLPAPFNVEPAILSTVGIGDNIAHTSGYRWMAGTSMAAPHVAGVLSLMLSINPDLTPDLAGSILINTVSPFSAQSPCITSETCGAGIINAGLAVLAAKDLLYLQSPSSFAPAFAGDAAAPRTITVVTRQANKPEETVVMIGGLPAPVRGAVVTQGGLDFLTVQPDVMPLNGLYDLVVTINGTPYTQLKAVQFGQKVFLPTVIR